MRSKVLYIITSLLLLSTTSLYPQKDGATPLSESAMEHLYPRPERWSGARYTTPPSPLNRLYLTLGVENYGTWSYDGGKSDELNGWMSRLGVGYTISPVHSVELGASWNDWDMGGMASRFDASYLFNVTAFANRTEQPTRWELFMKFGAEGYIDMFSEGVAFGASGAFKVKYNLSPSVGLYVEPKLSFVGFGSDDLNTSLRNNLFMPSVSFGMTVNIGQIRDNIKSLIDYRRDLWSNSDNIFKPLFAVKTNVLFDVATITNIEIEVPITSRWSIAGEWVFPWWSSPDVESSDRNCVQLLNGNLEGKYWFGDRTNRPVMTGWHVGLYAGGGLYDLEYQTKGYQGEFFIAAGLSGGYAHTINKRGTLRMEYSMSVGYLRTNYDHYNEYWHTIDNKWIASRENLGYYSWFGPTRARVSLVWMLHRKSNNRR